MDQSHFYKIASIVDQILAENDLPEHWFNKFLAWAIRGLEEIKLDVWQDVKTCLLPVTDRKTVVLPSDFVDWVKVGAPRGQYVVTMGVNDALRTDARQANRSDLVNGLMSQNLPNGLDFTNYGGYYFFNYGGASIVSLGGGLPSKGYFKLVDHGTCKELLLDYDYGCQEVYIEYITNGFDPCGETVVHAYLKDYLIKYTEFKFEEKNNPKANESSIFRKGQAVYFAERVVRARFNPLTPKDMLNLSRRHTRLTAKI
jgi:hypothetical protein